MNARCGLHVHVGVNRDDMAFMKRFLMLGIAFEDLFFASQPAIRYSRSFCQPFERLWQSPFSSVMMTEPVNIPLLYYQVDPMGLRSHLGNHYDEMRYFGFNIHPALSGQIPTVEFRFHEGTIEPEDIICWAEFCSGFVQLAQSVEASNLAIEAVNIPSILTRLSMLEQYQYFTDRSIEYMKGRIKKYGRAYVASKGNWSMSDIKK